MKKCLLFSLIFAPQIYAAQLTDLSHEQFQKLVPYLKNKPASSVDYIHFKKVNQFIDKHHLMHIRLQQFYKQYPIWNAISVLHVNANLVKYNNFSQLRNLNDSQIALNGFMFEKLGKDISEQSFNAQNLQQALNISIQAFNNSKSNHGALSIKDKTIEKIIYIDHKQKAHSAYHISFYSSGVMPSKPNFIIDAINHQIYKTWDEIKTISLTSQLVRGGGYGGNIKTGAFIYDGKLGNLPAFMVKRKDTTCYFKNEDTEIRDAVTDNIVTYDCPYQNLEFNRTYWSGDFDSVNGGYSPANDAMFAASIIQHIYNDWYGVYPLENEMGESKLLKMFVHIPKFDNAYWDGEEMVFGDGLQLFPLTSLGVAVHEVSHGFTQSHSNLNYYDQSGAINESFSDMAAQVAEYYAFGKSSWQIGAEIFKFNGEALRYMDLPSRECYGKEPGTFCSIDSAYQYYEGLDVHFSSGVFNRFFYLLSNSENWTPRKAFEVVLQANTNYWTSATTFSDGAACVIKASMDLGYETNDVIAAFKEVGIEPKEACTNQG